MVDDQFELFDRRRHVLLANADELEQIVGEFKQTGIGAAGDLGTAPDGLDPLLVGVAEARQRLRNDVIEVGVFGEVKRGKSTLINALIGREVSSMRVTPETAVPIWVERGTGPSTVVFEDGSTRNLDDPRDALDYATQRFRKSRKDNGSHDIPEISRVIVRVDAAWLPRGIRLIDTPGLADPSLTDVYEELTLAELERVAAAVVVLVSPPTISSSEVRFLRAVDERQIAKSFLVCNFYPDHWDSPDTREEVRDYIEEIVDGRSGDDAARADDLKLYDVNAKAGWVAIQANDETGYDDSGVGRLRRDLASFVTEGAAQAVLNAATRGLHESATLLRQRIHERMQVLSDPSSSRVLTEKIEGRVRATDAEAAAIIRWIREQRSAFEKEMLAVAREPFDVALDEVDRLTTASSVERMELGLRVRVETAGSRLDLMMKTELRELENEVRRRLWDAFGVDEAPGVLVPTPHGTLIPPGVIAIPPAGGDGDWAASITAGGAIGLGTGLIGGSLAGGVGLALIAAGPAGWIIGAGVGAVVGVLIGTAGMKTLLGKQLSPEARSSIRSQLDGVRVTSQRQVVEVIDAAISGLTSSVESMARSHKRESEVELDSIRQFISDPAGLPAVIRTTTDLKVRIDTMCEQLAG